MGKSHYTTIQRETYRNYTLLEDLAESHYTTVGELAQLTYSGRLR